MMWPYYGGGGIGWMGWLWMAGSMIVFWGGVILLAVWLIRSVSSPKDRSDDAMSILRRRLAAGEITQDEFDKTRRLLQG